MNNMVGDVWFLSEGDISCALLNYIDYVDDTVFADFSHLNSSMYSQNREYRERLNGLSVNQILISWNILKFIHIWIRW